MGYSTSVSCKSVKHMEKMLKFLKEHVEPWSLITKDTPIAFNPDYDYTRFIRGPKDLSYGASKTRVGFDFSIQDAPGEYMWAILKWTAIKVGRKTRFPSKLGHKLAVPYTTYDGYEHDPVIFAEHCLRKEAIQYVVSELGTKTLNKESPFYAMYFWNHIGLADIIIKDAIKRLDIKWADYLERHK